MSPAVTALPIRVFISYRHASHEVLDEIRDHLGWLENNDQIKVFDDRNIDAGDDWDKRIKGELEQSEIIIFLINAKFMSSTYCTKVELKKALERRAEEGTRLIPLITEACDWEAMPIFKLAALPKDKSNNLKPLNKWRGDKDVALAQLAKQLREIVERLMQSKPTQYIPEQAVGVNVAEPSVGYGEHSIMRFINETGKELTIYWSGYNGILERWGSIDIGKEFEQNTWIGHVWVLRDTSGKKATFKARNKLNENIVNRLD
jgi:hypothetical protein